MLELSRAAQNPITLSAGGTRTFIEDGDCITLAGKCQREGFTPIGFGEASGRVLPVLP